MSPANSNESWSELQPEILENILSFLPLRALVSCRGVCKRWKKIIGATPTIFKELEDKPVKDSHKKVYSLVTPNAFGTVKIAPQDWTLIDFWEGRWCTLEDKFLNQCLEGMEAFHERRTVASGGSLICVLYVGLQQDDHAMVVCNPVAETAKQLPPLTLHTCYSNGKLNSAVIMVELENLQYKIFVINDFNKKAPASSRMHVFESSAQQWQILCNPPADCIAVSSYIMFRGLLYTLFWDGMGHILVTYDIHGNKWNEVDVQLPESLRVPQLAVACDRLFMMAGRNKKWRLEIHELKVKEKTTSKMSCKLRTAMPSKKCMKVYEDGPWSTVNNNIGLNSNFTTFGSKSTIYVMRSPERPYYYNFEEAGRGYWGKAGWGYPWDEPWPPHRNLCDSTSGWYGGHMSIGLPSTPL